jgi:toxin ParE1/3/4
MSRSVTRKPRARVDLLEQFDYFVEHGGVELAGRYFGAVEATCAQLGTFPFSGSPYLHPLSRQFEGLRRIPVADFEHYLIFYMPVGEGIDVVRVLHAARDIESILAEEE